MKRSVPWYLLIITFIQLFLVLVSWRVAGFHVISTFVTLSQGSPVSPLTEAVCNSKTTVMLFAALALVCFVSFITSLRKKESDNGLRHVAFAVLLIDILLLIRITIALMLPFISLYVVALEMDGAL